MANFSMTQAFIQGLQYLMKQREERGNPGRKQAQTALKAIEKLLNGEGDINVPAAKKLVKTILSYSPDFWTESELSLLRDTLNAYAVADMVPWLADVINGAAEEDANDEKKHALTLEDFDSYLIQQGIELRYNAITRTYENGGILAADFTADAYSNLVNQYTRVTPDIVEMYAARLSRMHSYNPVYERIEGITWDGVDRISELCDVIRVSERDTLSRVLVRKWTCQAIALAQNDGETPMTGQGVLVLQGAQGAGKSSLCRRLAFDDSTLYTDAKLKVDDRDSQARVTAHWICELSELGRLFRSNDGDALKNFLTSPKDEFRVPYGRRDESYPRRVCFIATLNPKGSDYRYLNDDGGDRRFWTVLCNIPEGVRFDFEKENAMDIAQLWRQAFEEVEAKGSAAYELTDRELSELLKRNKTFMKPLPAEEELRDIIADAEDSEESWRRYKKERLSATDIKERNTSLRGFTVKQIGAALDRLGYEQDRRRRYEFWDRIYKDGGTLPAIEEKERENA